MQHAVACLLGGEDGGEQGGVGRGVGEGAGTVGGDVDFEEDQGRVGGFGGEGCEEGHLGWVVEHEGEGGGAEGGGDCGEAGEDGGVEGEGVEDVDGAALGLEGLEQGRDLLGLVDRGDDDVGWGVRVLADLEPGELGGLYHIGTGQHGCIMRGQQVLEYPSVSSETACSKTNLVCLYMRTKSNAVFLGRVSHPLAVDFQLGEIQDDAGRRHLVERLAHQALLEGALG